MAHVINDLFRTPSQGSPDVSFDIAKAFSDLADGLDKVLGPSRERSLVMTKLQEAHFWAQSAPQK